MAGRLAARRRAHAIRRLQRRARADLADRSRHQGGARGVRALRRVAGGRRHGHHRQHGAGELRCVSAAAPHRALCRRADRDAGPYGAARVRHRHRGADAGGRHDHAQGRRSRALRRHRVDEPQPDRRLHAPRRLPDGAGRVQGFPLGSPDGPLRQRHHGRHGGEPCAAVSDHARRGGRVRGAQLRARREGEGVGLPRGRDRAGENRRVRARRLQRARHQAVARDEGSRSRHPHPPFARRSSSPKSAPPSAACRPAAIPPPSSMARRRRWPRPATTRRSTTRRRSARLVAGAAAGVPPEIMGIGPVPAIQALLEKAGPEALRHRPLRDQRGVRRAGDGLRARARPRRGQAQRQWRRHRDRPSARRDRRAPLGHAGARAEALGLALRHRVRLHRRRAGHRAVDREYRAQQGRH